MKLTSSIIAFLAASTLASCSASSGSLVPPLPQQQSVRSNTAGDASGIALVVRIRVPRERHGGGTRAHYISAATKGMVMAFVGPTTVTSAISLTTSDPRCSGSPLICTIRVGLRAGKYTATFSTYDQAPVSGTIPVSANLLSTGNGAFTIVLGIANTLSLTLDGVPASIIVGGFPSASAGSAFSDESFSVIVKDADGEVIVGKYTTPITLTDTDTSGATSIATKGNDAPPARTLLSSADTATMNYSGLAIRPVKIVASASAIKSAGQFIVRLPIFVGDHAAVKEIPPGCASAGCVVTLGGGFTGPTGVAVDGSGNVYAADTGSSTVKKIPNGCTSAACVATLGGGFSFPRGVATDGSGNVFVGDWHNNAVKKIPAGCAATSCVVTLGGGFNFPSGVALDGLGNVFVADEGNNAVKKIPPGCVTKACVTTLGGGFSDPLGVAIDGSGNIFVADFFNNAVKRMPPGCVSARCVTTIGGGWYFPESVAVDGFGNVIVADFRNNAVKEIPPGCTSASCVTVLGGGFLQPAGVGVL